MFLRILSRKKEKAQIEEGHDQSTSKGAPEEEMVEQTLTPKKVARTFREDPAVPVATTEEEALSVRKHRLSTDSGKDSGLRPLTKKAVQQVHSRNSG